MNPATRLPYGQGETWISHIVSWYEFPTNDTDQLEIWGYTDRLSYAPGDEVALHVSTTASEYSIEIFRDGGIWQSVFKQEGVRRAHYAERAGSLREVSGQARGEFESKRRS